MRILIANLSGIVGARSEPPARPLVGPQLAELPVLERAWLLVERERIAAFGSMHDPLPHADQVVDGTGRYVFPCWCDSHTHLVFAASREAEWVDRLRGLPYETIAERGGGILNSARRLRETPEEVLFEQALQRLDEVRRQGTGAIEIKSGYGLSTDSELKMLRVIRRLRQHTRMPIRATFLGAHALPAEYRHDREAYIRLIVEEMLPRVASEGLADYVDVFCEKVAFTVEEMEQVLEAASRYGLKPKVHVNQFHCLGGVGAAIRYGAVSVDHLEVLDEADLEALKTGQTIATLLPTAPFFLGDPLPPARTLIEAGVPVALASDFNPGTSPSGRMPFVVSLACIGMRMLPEESIQAATVNGAHAMEWGNELGCIAPGMMANLFLTVPMPSVAYLPYAFGSDLVERVMLDGAWS